MMTEERLAEIERELMIIEPASPNIYGKPTPCALMLGELFAEVREANRLRKAAEAERDRLRQKLYDIRKDDIGTGGLINHP